MTLTAHEKRTLDSATVMTADNDIIRYRDIKTAMETAKERAVLIEDGRTNIMGIPYYAVPLLAPSREAAKSLYDFLRCFHPIKIGGTEIYEYSTPAHATENHDYLRSIGKGSAICEGIIPGDEVTSGVLCLVPQYSADKFFEGIPQRMRDACFRTSAIQVLPDKRRLEKPNTNDVIAALKAARDDLEDEIIIPLPEHTGDKAYFYFTFDNHEQRYAFKQILEQAIGNKSRYRAFITEQSIDPMSLRNFNLDDLSHSARHSLRPTDWREQYELKLSVPYERAEELLNDAVTRLQQPQPGIAVA